MLPLLLLVRLSPTLATLSWACSPARRPAGNEVHAALAACMPPPVTLQCQPVAWLPGGLVELEVTGA